MNVADLPTSTLASRNSTTLAAVSGVLPLQDGGAIEALVEFVANGGRELFVCGSSGATVEGASRYGLAC